jgi:hypothetical protein
MTEVCGIIPLNKNTTQHQQTLTNLGYDIEVDNDEIVVWAEFLPDGKSCVYDISTPDKAQEFFALLTRGKRLINFHTRLELPDGHKKYGVHLARILQDAEGLRAKLGYDPSALIATKVDTEE